MHHQQHPFIELLLIGAVFFASLSFILLKILPADYYPAWDQAHHLSVAGGYYWALVNMNVKQIWHMLTLSDTIYPPFFHLLVAFGYIVFGIKEKIGPLVNFPFMLLLGLSTYQLSRLTVSKKSAVYAGVLIFFVPLYLDLWTDAMTDITSVALFITLYWAVLKTDYFTSPRWSVITGIVGLFLILSRYAFFSAALPLFVYTLISIKRNRLSALANILTAVICVSPALLWYVPHWSKMYEKLTFFGDPNNYPVQIYGLPNRFELKNWLYFPLSSIQIQGIGLVPMVLFLVSLASGFYRKTPFGKYLVWSVLCNFIIQTVWLDKIPKYVSYSYPIILILVVAWIFTLPKITKRLLLLILLVSMTANFVIGIVYFPNPRPVGKLGKNIYLLPGTKYEYTIGQWPIKQIVSDIPINERGRTWALSLTDHHILNGVTLSYYASLLGKPIDVDGAATIYNPVRPKPIKESDIASYDFIITKTKGDFGVFVNYDTTYQINQLLAESDKFFLARIYKLPDGSRALLYQVLFK